jgi:hypothetical protein
LENGDTSTTRDNWSIKPLSLSDDARCTTSLRDPGAAWLFKPGHPRHKSVSPWDLL